MSRRLYDKKKVEEAVTVFENFREACKLQIDLGYWVTIDFPSKHHLNHILAVQFLDSKDLELKYGAGLVNRLHKALPHAKRYLAFIRDLDEKDNSGTYSGKRN